VELEELSDGTQCSAKEKCENDGNAKCRDALLPFICAHAFYNIKSKASSSGSEKREETHICEEAKCRAAAPTVRKTSVRPLWAFFR
jgi:hypothetical protein